MRKFVVALGLTFIVLTSFLSSCGSEKNPEPSLKAEFVVKNSYNNEISCKITGQNWETSVFTNTSNEGTEHVGYLYRTVDSSKDLFVKYTTTGDSLFSYFIQDGVVEPKGLLFVTRNDSIHSYIVDFDSDNTTFSVFWILGTKSLTSDLSDARIEGDDLEEQFNSTSKFLATGSGTPLSWGFSLSEWLSELISKKPDAITNQSANVDELTEKFQESISNNQKYVNNTSKQQKVEDIIDETETKNLITQALEKFYGLLDCNGTFGGKAYLDACSKCSGGTTGLRPNAGCDSNWAVSRLLMNNFRNGGGIWLTSSYFDSGYGKNVLESLTFYTTGEVLRETLDAANKAVLFQEIYDDYLITNGEFQGLYNLTFYYSTGKGLEEYFRGDISMNESGISFTNIGKTFTIQNAHAL